MTRALTTRTAVRVVVSAALATVAAIGLTVGGQPASADDDEAREYYQLRNDNSRKCLTVQATANETALVQYSCGDSPDQYWQLEPVDDGYYRIRNLLSKKCLLVRGTGNEAAVVQYTCGPYMDQHWDVRGDGAGYYQFQNRYSGKCLIARGAANGAHAVQHTCIDEYADQWWSVD